MCLNQAILKQKGKRNIFIEPAGTLLRTVCVINISTVVADILSSPTVYCLYETEISARILVN